MSVKVKTWDNGLAETQDQPVWIGMDQSYAGFGLTILDEAGYFTTEVFEVKGLTGTERLLAISDHLRDVLRDARVDYALHDIAMEGYAFGSQTANMAGELGATVKLTTALTTSMNPLIVTPTQLKKFATGKGTGVSKSQILLSVYKTWGAEFTDDNAADSYVLAKIAVCFHHPQYIKNRAQDEVIAKLRTEIPRA